MKANELMIGDLVQLTISHKPVIINGITYDSKIAKKHLIHFFFVNDGDARWNYSPESFEPIPITPEILEKNDIHETNKNHWFWERKPHTNTDIMYQAEEICFDKEFPRKENGGLHTGGFVRVASEHGMVYGECEYVHELQHALKHCRIEKEIKC